MAMSLMICVAMCSVLPFVLPQYMDCYWHVLPTVGAVRGVGHGVGAGKKFSAGVKFLLKGGAGRTVRAPCIFFIWINYQTPLSYFVVAR